MVLVADEWPRKNGVKKITEQAVKNAALFDPPKAESSLRLGL